MSKLAFDYSKWDNLDTDDSDAEPAPAPIQQEDDTQQKGWRPHADPILQVKDLSKFVISYELEAVFDAQAFDKGTPRAKRALRAVLKGNLARLDSTLAWDYDRAEEAFAKDIKPSVNTTECCYILFRTKTWALFVWAPTDHVDADAYTSRALELREALGGQIRIPNVFSWFRHEDVVLDKSVTDAPALSLSIEQAGGVEGVVSPAERSKGAAVPSTVPDPPAPRSAL